MTDFALPEGYEENDQRQRSKTTPHERFAANVGNWKVTTRHSEMFGGQVHTGECSMRLILDGKFLLAEGTSNMMGQDCTTYGLFGYDSLTEEFTAINLNSLYTSIYELRGKARADGVIEYTGIMKDAMTVDGRQYRVEERPEGPDKFEIVVFDGPPDGEFEVLTMTYERQ